MNLSIPTVSVTTIASILATGVLLNWAGSGVFGVTIQKAAQYVTKGYGV